MSEHPFFLAHETAHRILRHRTKRCMVWCAHGVLSWFITRGFNYPDCMAFVLFPLILGASAPFWFRWMHRQEIQADILATTLVGYPSARDALQNLEKTQPLQRQRSRFYSTHPTPQQRLSRLRHLRRFP